MFFVVKKCRIYAACGVSQTPNYYMIKGVQGKDYFRIAVHGKHEDELQRLEEFLYSGQKKE